MKYRISAIFMDLDGTSLQKDHESFTPHLLQVLMKLHEKGIRVIPCTGRPYGLLPSVLKKKADWMHLSVCSDGAVICDLKTGDVLSAEYIQRKDADALMELSKDPDIAVEAMSAHCVYLSRESLEKERREAERLSFHLQHVVRTGAVFSDSPADLIQNDRIEKMNLFCLKEKSRRKIQELVAKRKLSCSETEPMHFEVTSGKVSKAEAMRKVCLYDGIPLTETMAVGDSENDRSMLETAGVSVAVKNAPEEIRKICMVTADRYDEDGVAKILEKLL